MSRTKRHCDMTIFLLVDIVNKFRSTILDKDLLFTLSTHHLYIHITYLLVYLRILVNVYLHEDNIELHMMTFCSAYMFIYLSRRYYHHTSNRPKFMNRVRSLPHITSLSTHGDDCQHLYSPQCVDISDLLMESCVKFGGCVDADKSRPRNFKLVDTIAKILKSGTKRAVQHQKMAY